MFHFKILTGSFVLSFSVLKTFFCLFVTGNDSLLFLNLFFLCHIFGLKPDSQGGIVIDNYGSVFNESVKIYRQ
ncbi:hypothetical protein D1164_12965 [Mariniphaga sediminis]|uniref:Uncharacterized protein n=1 Tax=Mariniphaga sediminis TaxID=1628158 RepID=A0A399D2M6_9BACT|nr:hypothetical protein D1164_12965 [Mariniphaga sediminis]